MSDSECWWRCVQQSNVELMRDLRTRGGARETTLWDFSPGASLLALGGELLAALGGKVPAGECVRMLLLYESEDALLSDVTESQLAAEQRASVVVLTSDSAKHVEAMQRELHCPRLLCLRDAAVENRRSSKLLYNQSTFTMASKNRLVPHDWTDAPLGPNAHHRLLLCTTFGMLRKKGKPNDLQTAAEARSFDAALCDASCPRDDHESRLSLPHLRCVVVHRAEGGALPRAAPPPKRKASHQGGATRLRAALSAEEEAHNMVEVGRGRLHRLFSFQSRIGFASACDTGPRQVRAAWEAWAGARVEPTADAIRKWEESWKASAPDASVAKAVADMRAQQRVWLRVLFWEALVDQRRSEGAADRERALDDVVRRWNEAGGAMLYALLAADESSFVDVDEPKKVRAAVEGVTECERAGLAGASS